MTQHTSDARPPLAPSAIIARSLVVIAILAVAVFAKNKIIDSGPHTSRVQPQVIAPLVTTVRAQMHQQLVFPIHALGTVVSAQEVILSPRVGGTITQRKLLEPGRRYATNDIIATIDSSDFISAIAGRQAEVQSAQAALLQEMGQQAIAAAEWELFQRQYAAHADSDTDAGTDTDVGTQAISDSERQLILRVPALKTAQARVDSAQAALSIAQRNLERCTIRAPFDCIVLSTNIALGSQVTPQTPLCTLSDSSVFWVRASLPAHSLAHLLPRNIGTSTAGSSVRIQPAGNATSPVEWHGELIRILPQVEEQGRLATVLIAVNQPLTGTTPLLLGSAVSIHISAQPLRNVIPVASAHMHKNTLWLLNDDNTLRIQPVSIAWVDRQTTYINSGLADGARIITSHLGAAITGMTLRTPVDDNDAVTTSANTSTSTEE